jgi:hypothetical protein
MQQQAQLKSGLGHFDRLGRVPNLREDLHAVDGSDALGFQRQVGEVRPNGEEPAACDQIGIPSFERSEVVSADVDADDRGPERREARREGARRAAEVGDLPAGDRTRRDERERPVRAEPRRDVELQRAARKAQRALSPRRAQPRSR